MSAGRRRLGPPYRSARATLSLGRDPRGLWLVREVRAQPALDLRERQALPGGVVLDLVAPDAADREVPRLRMTEMDAADARAGHHRVALREGDADLLCPEQVEELPLLAVVRARGIPERRADAAEALLDQLFLRSRGARLVPLAPRDLVQVLGERLCEAVGERLRHDRAVVVVVRLEARAELLEADAGG